MKKFQDREVEFNEFYLTQHFDQNALFYFLSFLSKFFS